VTPAGQHKDGRHERETVDYNAETTSLNPARAVPADRWPRLRHLHLGDGYRTGVFVHCPPPESKKSKKSNRLPVVYAHGIQSHPGWFVGSAMALAEAGHAVYQVTRRGSGANQHARGHAASAGQLLRDVDAACRFAEDDAPSDAVHLVGVSWGGKLLASYAAAAQRSVRIASLTLIAPGVVPRVDVPFGTKLGIALALLVSPRRQFDIPLSEPALFTGNEPMLEYLRRDPLRLHRATARFLYASRRLDIILRRARQGCIDVPTTLLLARDDRIIDNAATREAIERLSAGRAAVRQFDGAHTLEFEPDPTALYGAIVDAVAAGRPDGLAQPSLRGAE